VTKARRGATALSGVLLVDKPAGISSHGVIARLRRLTGEGRIGHAGTLDPEATGLLVVLFGPATKLSETLHGADKRYEATIRFGAQTTTDDREGEVIARSDVSSELFDPARAQALLDTFIGVQEQQPPQFSAIKVGGVKAYEAARKGRELEVAPRQIEVFEARLLACDPATQTWTVDFCVSKGTYIRALARDIGRAAGTHAYLSGLRRTQSGTLRLDNAHALEEIEQYLHAADAGGDPLALADLFCERAILEHAWPTDAYPRQALPYRVAGPRRAASVVALGVFDGVHRGHQALLAAAREAAGRAGQKLCVLCFDPLPEQTICPSKAPALLTDVTQRIKLLKHYGADQVEVIDFSPALAQASPEFFATQALPSRVTPTHLFVGENFRFGAGAQGDVELLARLLDCPVTAAPLARATDGAAISATTVRALMAEGQLEAAYELLGHPLDLRGTVVRGNGQGRALGYPTANLRLAPACDPLCFAPGIYAATATIAAPVPAAPVTAAPPTATRSYPAGLFIGHVQTPGFAQPQASVEAHLLDYDGPELYGQELTLTVRRRIDTPRRFETARELSEAIGAWLFAIREYLIVE